MFKVTKQLFSGVMLAMALMLVVPNFVLAPQAVSAQSGLIPPPTEQVKNIPGGQSAGQFSPVQVVQGAIYSIGGVLGLVATLIVLYAGFMWMTAMGDEGKVKTAKQMLQRAAIGLVIILSASLIAGWAITQFSATITTSGR